MALEFISANNGWSLNCDECSHNEFEAKLQLAHIIIDDQIRSYWEFDEYANWDGITFADALCPECNGTYAKQEYQKVNI